MIVSTVLPIVCSIFKRTNDFLVSSVVETRYEIFVSNSGIVLISQRQSRLIGYSFENHKRSHDDYQRDFVTSRYSCSLEKRFVLYLWEGSPQELVDVGTVILRRTIIDLCSII